MTKESSYFIGRSRFFDLMRETGNQMPCVCIQEQLVNPSLEAAIEYMIRNGKFKIDSEIQRKTLAAQDKFSKNENGTNLTVNECAAIQLYTMESKKEQESLYYVINTVLRQEDRDESTSFTPYLRILLRALQKLPTVQGVVYRAVNGNISSNFVKEKPIIWWGFSSCTKSLDMLSTEEFLGTRSQRTVFYIQCLTGKSIESYSYSSVNDQEVLLLPGTEFLVTNKERINRAITIIHLREVRKTLSILDGSEFFAGFEIKLQECGDFRQEAKEKECGHQCHLLATKKCCNCSDKRPVQQEGSYEKYVDGIGFVNEAYRNEYYCPACKLNKVDV